MGSERGVYCRKLWKSAVFLQYLQLNKKILKIYRGKNKHDAYEYIFWKMDGGKWFFSFCVLKGYKQRNKERMDKTALVKL